jgi:hypothetical protein
VPPRGDTITFTMTIRGPSVMVDLPPPVIQSVARVDGQATFTIATIPGRTYRVLYADTLGPASWKQLYREFVAANSTASISDPGAASHRFYQVLRLD